MERFREPQWLVPRNAAEAMVAIREDATPVGGGAALLSAAFLFSAGTTIVDLRHALSSSCTPPHVGAGVTIAYLTTHAGLAAGWPAVAQAAASTANPGVRRVATVGGTVAARLPTSDLAAPLVAHGAVVVLETLDGPRFLPLLDYLDAASGLGPHLVTGLDLGPPARGAYRRVAGRFGPAPALATVAGVLRDDGTVLLCAGACAPAPLLFAPGDVPHADRLLDDDRASAPYRARLLAALAAEVAEVLG